MQKDFTISVFEVVGSSLCVASGDGQKIYDRLASVFKTGAWRLTFLPQCYYVNLGLF